MAFTIVSFRIAWAIPSPRSARLAVWRVGGFGEIAHQLLALCKEARGRIPVDVLEDVREDRLHPRLRPLDRRADLALDLRLQLRLEPLGQEPLGFEIPTEARQRLLRLPGLDFLLTPGRGGVVGRRVEREPIRHGR